MKFSDTLEVTIRAHVEADYVKGLPSRHDFNFGWMPGEPSHIANLKVTIDGKDITAEISERERRLITMTLMEQAEYE